jgi:exodeoxyribonuclease VII large subunit
MAFNGEALARAIRVTRLPVVAGIGHETDTTVADLASDRRAATPSAAAELVAPSVAVLRDDVAARRARLALSITATIATHRHRVQVASMSLRQALRQEALLKRVALDRQRSRLALVHPSRRVEIERLHLSRAEERLQAATVRVTVARHAALQTRAARLAALSPRRTLERGYSITSDHEGRVLTDAASARMGTRLRTVLLHGALESLVDRVQPDDTNVSERMYDRGDGSTAP